MWRLSFHGVAELGSDALELPLWQHRAAVILGLNKNWRLLLLWEAPGVLGSGLVGRGRLEAPWDVRAGAGVPSRVREPGVDQARGGS